MGEARKARHSERMSKASLLCEQGINRRRASVVQVSFSGGSGLEEVFGRFAVRLTTDLRVPNLVGEVGRGNHPSGRLKDGSFLVHYVTGSSHHQIHAPGFLQERNTRWEIAADFASVTCRDDYRHLGPPLMCQERQLPSV